LQFTLCQSAVVCISAREAQSCIAVLIILRSGQAFEKPSGSMRLLSTKIPLRILFCFRSRGEKESGVAAMEVQSRVGKNVVEDPRDLPPVILMDED